MVSLNVNRYARDSLGVFAVSTIKGDIQPGGGNVAGVPGAWAKYAHTLFCFSVISEADRVMDSFSNFYDVHHISFYCDGDNYQHRVCELVKISAFTLQTLTLGATADSITGHYPVTYTDSTIYGNLSFKGQSAVSTSAGYYNRYEYVFVTASTILEGDRVEDVDGTVYEIKQVTQYKSSRTDFAFYWKICGCVKVDFAVQPATSGIWHVDSTAEKTDVRYRWKVWIASNLTASTITKDNGSTTALTHTCFENKHLPLTQIFLTKAIAALATINIADSKPLLTKDKSTYGYDETAEITIHAVNKADITAVNLLEKYDQAFREAVTNDFLYALKSIRSIISLNTENIDLGSNPLYTLKIRVGYKRSNDEYIPLYPSISYAKTGGGPYTFICPNCIQSPEDISADDAWLKPFGFSGKLRQAAGSGPLEVTTVHDLDLDTQNYLWLRDADYSQDGTAPADANPEDVFLEIIHSQGVDQPYCVLNLGGKSFNANLISHHKSADNKLTLIWREYRATNAGTETYLTRWGIT
jgi:hypothetical protein